MDPAFKQYRIKPASRLATAVSFDQSAFLNLPPTDPRTPYQFLAGNLQAYLNAAKPGATVDDVVRSSSIVPTSLPIDLPEISNTGSSTRRNNPNSPTASDTSSRSAQSTPSA